MFSRPSLHGDRGVRVVDSGLDCRHQTCERRVRERRDTKKTTGSGQLDEKKRQVAERREDPVDAVLLAVRIGQDNRSRLKETEERPERGRERETYTYIPRIYICICIYVQGHKATDWWREADS